LNIGDAYVKIQISEAEMNRREMHGTRDTYTHPGAGSKPCAQAQAFMAEKRLAAVPSAFAARGFCDSV
jgi:hypothetical protein